MIEPTTPPPRFLIMAAGAARRFGARKQLATLANGQALLQTVYDQIAAISTQLCVIVSPDHADVRRLCEHQGMAHWIAPYPPPSLAHSIALAVAAHADDPGWIIALADMPLIRAATYQRVQQAMREDRIVVPITPHGQTGHPVAFGRSLRADLIALADPHLEPPSGARRILQRYPERILRIPCDDPGIVLDIDRPSDIKQHLQSANPASDIHL